MLSFFVSQLCGVDAGAVCQVDAWDVHRFECIWWHRQRELKKKFLDSFQGPTGKKQSEAIRAISDCTRLVLEFAPGRHG